MLAYLYLSGIILILLYFWKNSKPSNFPPGPKGLPIIGNLHQLGSKPYKTFAKMRNIYGDIFSLKLGSYRAVVLNNWEDIKDALAQNSFSGRSDQRAILDRCGGIPRGLIFNYGQGWTEQRRFVMKILSQFGCGKQSMESIFSKEICELLKNLEREVGKPIENLNIFNAPILNALWAIVAGQRFEQNDKNLQILLRNLISSRTQGRSSTFIRYFPWLYTIKKLLSKLVHSEYERHETIKKNIDFVNMAVKAHQRSLNMNSEPGDFIDAYLHQIVKTKDPESSFYKEEGYKNLSITLMDLFVAGAETTATALSWALLFLAMHQDKQQKLFEEIQGVVGMSRQSSLKDRQMMPFTEAVINEILRVSSIAPLAVSHSTTQDISFHGYKLPKGTLIIPNLYGAMHDPVVWGDPDVFRPERFLSPDGKLLLKHTAFIPFSTGKRICIGVGLAKDEMFLFITSLFQKFKVEPDPAGKPLSTDCFSTSVLVPKPHRLVLKNRR